MNIRSAILLGTVPVLLANAPSFIDPAKSVGPWILEKDGRRCRIELTKQMSPRLGRYLLKDPNKCTDRFFGGSKTSWFPSSESIMIEPVDGQSRGHSISFNGRVKNVGVEPFIGVRMTRPEGFEGPRDISVTYRQSSEKR
jgi:hypothetical protein